MLLLSLATFDPRDPSLNHAVSGAAPIFNQAGRFGAHISGFLADMLGLAAYAPSLFLLLLGSRRILILPPWPWWRWSAFVPLACCMATGAEAYKLALGNIAGGGLLGHVLYSFCIDYFSAVGTGLVWGFLALLSIQSIFGFSWLTLLGRGSRVIAASARQSLLEMKEEFVRRKEKRLALAAFNKARKIQAEDLMLETEKLFPRAASPALEFKEEEGEPDFLNQPLDDEEPPWLRDLEADKIEARAVRGRQASGTGGSSGTGQPESSKAPVFSEPSGSAPQIHAPRTVLATAALELNKPGERRIALPPLDLIQSMASPGQGTPKEVLEAKGVILMNCLADFGIQGALSSIKPGPVVTMFEVRPAPGIKVSRIAGLSDDLALALKAIAVRIQAPIPGSDVVGIEIPNEIRETVCLRELFGSQVFQKAESLLTMALGKDISGLPVVADLARMPHLLVAGATGAGKSVCLNSILLSFLYKARPEEVKLLLVDPKRIEMAVYADLPHLVHPVVTEMNMAKNALDWAVSEMDRRYKAIGRLKARNIATYNARLAELGQDRDEETADLEFMPYLVIVIDELADLMLTAAKEVEISIVRLAQLARAAGIHMILATQRPSVDVVTGLIKANFPCRISFQVTSKHDSRTILDAVGAEHLLGKGDMLFKPGGGKFQRLHGAFVGDENVAAVTDYWRSRQKADYQIDFSDWSAEGTEDFSGAGFEDVAGDAVYPEAVEFVRQQGKASISLIQRRFRIGFNRAARFVEQMEKDGIIGPADGSKPRVVVR